MTEAQPARADDRAVRTGVIVLSLWTDGVDPADVVVRIRTAVGLRSGEGRESWAASGVEDMLATVARWVEDFARARPPRDGRGPADA